MFVWLGIAGLCSSGLLRLLEQLGCETLTDGLLNGWHGSAGLGGPFFLLFLFSFSCFFSYSFVQFVFLFFVLSVLCNLSVLFSVFCFVFDFFLF